MISQVWRTLAVLFVWDVLITIIYYVLPFRAPALPLRDASPHQARTCERSVM